METARARAIQARRVESSRILKIGKSDSHQKPGKLSCPPSFQFSVFSEIVNISSFLPVFFLVVMGAQCVHTWKIADINYKMVYIICWQNGEKESVGVWLQ